MNGYMSWNKSTWVRRHDRQFGCLFIAIAIGFWLAVSLACSLPNLSFSTPEQPTPTPEGMTPEPTGFPISPTSTPPLPSFPPTIVESDPLPGAVISIQGPIKLYFNQAMDRLSVENSIRSQPGLSGEFQWQDNATVEFFPDVPFSPASRLEIILDESVRATNGMSLIERKQLIFEVEGYLQMTRTVPGVGASDVVPTSVIVAGFNRPVKLIDDADDQSPVLWLEPEVAGRGEWVNVSTYIFYPEPALAGGVEYTVYIDPELQSLLGSPLQEPYSWSFSTLPLQMISIVPTPGARSVRLDSQVQVEFNQPMDVESVEVNLVLLDPDSRPVPGEFIWNEEFTQVSYKPRYFLKRDLTYTFHLHEGVMTLGGTRIEAQVETNWRTNPSLEVIGSDPTQNGLIDIQEHLTVYFSAPIQARNVLQFVSIIPHVEGLNASLEDGNRTLHLHGNFSPNTHYSLIISPNLPDAWSGRLGTDFVLNFRTNSLAPKLVLPNESDILFLTPQDSRLVAEVTNLEQIRYSIGSMPLDVFTQMLSTDGLSSLDLFTPQDRVSLQHNLELVPNQRMHTEIPLSLNGDLLSPGLYHLDFNLPSVVNPVGPLLLVTSNVNLTLKIGANDVLVWAVDLRDFEPISEAAISIYNEEGELLGSGLTDPEGVFKVSIDPLEDLTTTYFALLGQPGDDTFALALSTWNRGLQGWNYQISTDYQGHQPIAYLYSDRTVYQPGQTVFFRAVVRQMFNGRYSLLDVDENANGLLPVSLFDEAGDEIATFNLPLSEFWTVNGAYNLPPGIEPGGYRLVINNSSEASLEFQVLPGHVPDIELAVTHPEGRVLAGQRINAIVHANYSFGAPAGTLPIQWTVYREPAVFDLPGYQIGAIDTSWVNPQPPILPSLTSNAVLNGEGITDEEGKLVVEFPTTTEDGFSRYFLVVMAEDSSALPVRAWAEVLVYPTDYIIGLQPDSLIGLSGTSMGFEVKVVDFDQNPYGVIHLRAEFQKVLWERVETISPNEKTPVPILLPRYTLVGSTDFETASDGVARLSFVPDEPGLYQLDVVDYRSESPRIRTQTMIWVGGMDEAQWPDLPNNRLHLVPGKDFYLPGDTAQVFVPNPLSANALALVTVERGALLRQRVLDIEGAGTNLYLPLAGEDAPNVFVSVTLIGPSPNEVPEYRHGYVNLPVKPDEFSINIELQDLPDRLLPGEDLRFGILATDSEGRPVVGEFSLSVVEQSALTLEQVSTDSILDIFYSIQPLSVLTGIPLSACSHCPNFYEQDVTDENLELLPSQPVFHNWSPASTIYWDAEIVTNDQGEAEVVVPLPERVATWHIFVRGLTSDTRVGQVEATLEVTKQLLIRPVTPRFLVLGDQTRLKAEVFNNSQIELIVDVDLETNGFELFDPAMSQQRVRVPAGEKVDVFWQGQLQDAAGGHLVFSARSEIIDDGELFLLEDVARHVIGTIPVSRFMPSSFLSSTGMLENGDQYQALIDLPRSYEVRSGVLQVELSPSLAAAMMTSLENLENSSADSNEQLLSRSLPALYLFLSLREIELVTPGLQTRLDRILPESISRLIARQNSDGGWGWWPGQESDQYISAYVLYGLHRARAVGTPIDSRAFQQALSFLQSSLSAPDTINETWQLDRLTFAHFVLSQVGSGDPNAIADLYDLREQLNPGAKAWLALTLETFSDGDLRAESLRTDLISEAIRSENGIYWQDHSPDWRNLNSTLQTSAVVIYALAQEEVAPTLLDDAIRYLMHHRVASGLWSSSYETAWIIMAKSEALKHLRDQVTGFNFSATLNDTPLASGETGDVMQVNPVTATINLQELTPNFSNSLIIQRDEGTGVLYYSVQLLPERPVESVTGLQGDFYLTRQYFPAMCGAQAGNIRQDCIPISTAHSGDLVDVRLTLTVAETVYFVVVEDYIPAGAEILSVRSLDSSSYDGSGQPMEDVWTNGWGSWFFSEPRVYDDHITWAAQMLSPGTYELIYRLALLHPGEYSLLPAQAWQYYTTGMRSYSAGDRFTIEVRQ
jgi:alpha-2-macroglobulin